MAKFIGDVLYVLVKPNVLQWTQKISFLIFAFIEVLKQFQTVKLQSLAEKDRIQDLAVRKRTKLLRQI